MVAGLIEEEALLGQDHTLFRDQAALAGLLGRSLAAIAVPLVLQLLPATPERAVLLVLAVHASVPGQHPQLMQHVKLHTCYRLQDCLTTAAAAGLAAVAPEPGQVLPLL
jgi:hypothetical protein